MSVSGESPPGEKGKPVASGRRRHGRRKANQALSYTPRAGKQPCPQNNDDFLSEVLTSVIEFGGKKVLEDPFLRKFAEKCAEEHGSSISGITESASGEPSGASTRTENTSAATESERPRQGATVKDSQAPSQTIDQEFDQEPVLVPVRDIFPAPENAEIYNAISPDDPGVIALARSIKERGILDPPLVSKDGFIISGHRRRVAAQMAGLEKIPVRYHRLTRDENPEFTKLLVEANSQRIKDSPTLIRESMVRIDPKAAHQQIINERNEKELAWRDRMQRARAWIQSAPELAPNMQFPEGHAVDTTDESVWPRFFRRLCFWPASSRDRGLGHLLQPDKLKITELKQVSEATAYDRRMGG